MTARPDINALCRKYRNEDPHTQFVAMLALYLFDRMHETLGLSLEERDVLEHAALLHDIGYAADPPHHAAAGARIVRNEGIQGLSNKQCRQVAAVIRLHQRNLDTARADPVFTEAPRKHSALKLGALLRVADALDHGHLQDAAIQGIRKQDSAYTITAKSAWYPNNVRWAAKKADLWHAVMPVSLSFVDKSKPLNNSCFKGIVFPRDTVLGGARRLMYAQYRIIAENREAALEKEDPEHLHDIRVAMRRFRALCRFFKTAVKGTSARTVDEMFDHWGDLLGPIRDMNVWIKHLQKLDRRDTIRKDKAWVPYVERQQQINSRMNSEFRTLMQNREFLELMYTTVHLLKIELPERLRVNKKKHKALLPYAAIKIERGFKKIRRYRKAIQHETPEQMHQLRKRCRRMRYWAEFMAPVIQTPVFELARRCKAVADALGDLHDCDVHLQSLAHEEEQVPSVLTRQLHQQRNGAVRRFQSTWKKLNERNFRSEVADRLKAAKKGRLA
jgi:putative nucleotidyltransferase with HDIG domain